jgi:hypothetical protein
MSFLMKSGIARGAYSVRDFRALSAYEPGVKSEFPSTGEERVASGSRSTELQPPNGRVP